MSYLINTTNGNLLATIPDATLVQNQAGLLLIGKGYAGFGTALNNDLVYLAENFCNSTPPSNPLIGQLWYDSVNKVINVYNGTTFSTLSINTPAVSPPSSANLGDEWFDTVNQQLNVWDGSNWILIGPTSQAGSGLNGIVTSSLTQNNTVYYFADLYVSNQLLAIASSANLATQNITGFGNIRTGINFAISSANVSNVVLGGIYNASNITVGSTDQLALSISSTGDALIATQGNLAINAIGGGIYPIANSVVNLGSPTNRFNTIYVETINSGNVVATPGGANLQVQYNSNGIFAGASIYVNATNIAVVSNLCVNGNIISSGNIIGTSFISSGAITGTNITSTSLTTSSANVGALVVAGTANTSVSNISATLLSNGSYFVPKILTQATTSKTLGQTYTNTTNAPLQVCVCCQLSGTNTAYLQASIQYPGTSALVPIAANGLSGGYATVTFIVMPGYTYYVSALGSVVVPNIVSWVEWSWQ